jgi:hypothetical protein
MIPRALVWVIGASLAACASSPPASPPPTASASAHRPSRTNPSPVLTSADQARELAATQRAVTAMRWDVQRQLARAQIRGDRAESRCLDERLSELDASLRMLDEQQERFETAAGAGDERVREQSFRRAMTVRGRAGEVGEEARRCALGVVTEGTVTTMVVQAP